MGSRLTLYRRLCYTGDGGQYSAGHVGPSYIPVMARGRYAGTRATSRGRGEGVVLLGGATWGSYRGRAYAYGLSCGERRRGFSRPFAQRGCHGGVRQTRGMM